jgi:acetone carboxylase gamma subunit
VGKPVTFERLPVGACFAFDAGTKQATRRKVDARHTLTIPGGKRPLIVDDVDVRVHTKACPVSFGRRRKRRKNKRS